MPKDPAIVGPPLWKWVVVVGALLLLLAFAYVTLFPRVGNGLISSRLATKKNMEALWTWHKVYADRHGRELAKRHGHEFVLMPWVEKVCERSEWNFGRFWVDGVEDPHRERLLQRVQEHGWDSVWSSYADVSSTDTHFAGPTETQRERLDLSSGLEPMLATDNEHARLFDDGTVIVMMADKSFLELGPDILRETYGYHVERGGERGFRVGPESPDERLRKLEY